MLHMPDKRRLFEWCLCLLLVLPWINPFTAGPTPGMWPWHVSAACAVLVWFFWRRMSVELIALAWIWAGAISAVIGLLQYFGLSHAFSPWVSQTYLGDAFANLRQRNQFATLTSIALIALIGWFARRQPVDRVPAWGFALALLLALGNAVSGSRTGLLQWGLILAISMWWLFSVHRCLVFFVAQAMATYLLAVVALPWLLAVITGVHTGGLLGRLDEAPSCGSRKVLWSNVLTLIGQKPWAGWGWGELDYVHFITLYPGLRFCEILDNAHNLPLHLAVELGIPAALLVCGGFVWLVLRTKPWRETDPTRQMAWGVLAIILLHSMLEYPLWYGPFQMAFGLCLGLLWPSSRSPATDSNGNSPVALTIRGTLAAVLTTAIAYAAWDYHRISQIYLAPQARDAAYRDDTMNKIRGSWLFRNQVRFAELTITPLTRDNAQWTFNMATAQLHYSPEPRVIEKVIESAVLLGRDDEALAHLARYRAAFPADHARWAQANARASERLQPLR